ncbi:hypothetical protein [Pseudokineococcus sp. 1T1Z-3]|uniref:hypothetical protein n=1 Tax=Pseudokineococcus sp. 1T1Z-3 TaxID=3132745 RepID=UPI0030AEF81C
MDAAQLAGAAADTADPSQGLRAVAALRRVLETLELRQVEAALRSGASWSQVAAGLGVTRQAVHKKYAKRLRDAVTEGGERS